MLALYSSDGGATFHYLNVTGSPFDVIIGILDDNEYDSYDNIIQGGFGVTSNSKMVLPSTALAVGQSFAITIIPLNLYDQNFMYAEKEGTYFIINFSKVLKDGTNQCSCNSTL